MKVLAISGSLRAGSLHTRLLRAAAEHLPPGVDLEVYEGLATVPPYDEDADVAAAPAPVAALRDALRAADAVIFATPEYNGSIPGQLKNALDWVSRPLATNPLRKKPVAVVGGSTGLFGAVWAQADLRKVLGILGADLVEEELVLPTLDEALHPEHGLVDVAHRDALATVMGALHARAAEIEADVSVAA
jgi:chromate reductase